MAEHTPTPWQWDAGIVPPDGPDRYCDIYVDGGELIIAQVNDLFDKDIGRSNAAFIVKAVSKYDETQDLLADLWFHFSDTFDPTLKKIADRARTLLDMPADVSEAGKP